jgi:hypothetical protein
VGVFRCVFERTISRKSAAVGTGAIALRPLVDIVVSTEQIERLVETKILGLIYFPRVLSGCMIQYTVHYTIASKRPNKCTLSNCSLCGILSTLTTALIPRNMNDSGGMTDKRDPCNNAM